MIEEGFSSGNSIIHGLDPRVRTLIACAFSVIVAISDRFPALAVSVLISMTLAFLARLPIGKASFRLLMVNGFILLLWLFLPFTMGGETLFTLGPLTVAKKGVLYSALITVKSNAIILALMALVATMPVFTIGRAMRNLHVPGKIVYLLLFTYRYIHAIHREFWRQMNAIKIRGFQPGTNIHTYRTYAFLVGMLLVRSHDRAERVRAAMLCRGFRGRFYDLSEFALKGSDLVITALMLLAIICVGLLQWTEIIY
ncbi:MAG: cobalt ECF transporter T component CbiQ [Deltaproteobacteria bacterium]|nr:cobalt ECF transporter T component CbiQ [Deltaproteobacteria bacterium]